MQLKLIAGTWQKKRFVFGGSLLKNSHPKTKRIFRPQLPLHVVLHSQVATGRRSLFLHNNAIGRLIEDHAHRQSIRIFSVVNSGNHLHFLVQAPSQEHLSNFLRAVSGRIAQLVMGSRPGTGTVSQPFWSARPFSRIVSWGQDFRSVTKYLGMNALESLGLSRQATRQMCSAIHQALRLGQLTKTPGLLAAGFV